MKQNRPTYPRRSSFSLSALLPHIIFIAIVIGIYYYISRHNLFFSYLPEIYIAVKAIIAFDIFVASISSTLAPILTLLVGGGLLYLGQDYHFSLYSNAWQLIMMAGFGFFIRLLVR